MPDTNSKGCPHHRWEIRATDLFGFGHCLDCNQAVPALTLFNGLYKRLEAALERCNALASQLEEKLRQ